MSQCSPFQNTPSPLYPLQKECCFPNISWHSLKQEGLEAFNRQPATGSSSRGSCPTLRIQEAKISKFCLYKPCPGFSCENLISLPEWAVACSCQEPSPPTPRAASHSHSPECKTDTKRLHPEGSGSLHLFRFRVFSGQRALPNHSQIILSVST